MKEWNPYDREDPNYSANIVRTHYGLPPIDKWNVGCEYAYKGTQAPSLYDQY